MPRSSASNGNMSSGDWVCPSASCANVNFARRTVCNRCGLPKPMEMLSSSSKKVGFEIGKSAADKSKGLFSADDWQCGKCGNVNWARRSSCNVCNAPKVGEVEERTGFGGGFNEREGVEYKERQDSDNEYDDFGRKKKKYRGGDGSSLSSSTADPVKSQAAKNLQSLSKQSDGEQDDDDDDDDDLSKYDLSGWGDDGDDAVDKNKSSTSSSSKDRNRTKSSTQKRRRSSSSSSSSSASSRSRSRGGRSSRRRHGNGGAVRRSSGTSDSDSSSSSSGGGGSDSGGSSGSGSGASRSSGGGGHIRRTDNKHWRRSRSSSTNAEPRYKSSGETARHTRR